MQKNWIRLQAVLFPLITTQLVALGWQYYLHIRHMIRRKDGFELGCVLLRHVLWTLLVTSQHGLMKSTLIFLAFNWISANYICETAASPPRCTLFLCCYDAIPTAALMRWYHFR